MVISKQTIGIGIWISAVLLVAAIFYTLPFVFGLSALLLYFGLHGVSVYSALVRVNVERSLVNGVISSFLVFLFTTFLGSILLVMYMFTPLVESLLIIVTSACVSILYRMYGEPLVIPRWGEGVRKLGIHYGSSRCVPFGILVFLLFFLGFAAFALYGAPDRYMLTPWEVIPQSMVWVFVLLAFLLITAIFAFPRRCMLVAIVLFSVLIHVYIPAVYRTPYGIDDWRHAGFMATLDKYGVIAPYSITPYTEWTKLGPLKIPSALLGQNRTKTSYGHYWSAGIFLHDILDVDFVTLTVWWNMVLFSVFAPLMFFTVTRLANKEPHQNLTVPLLTAFLPIAFYPFQLYGSTSLPVGFDFLSFLVFLITISLWQHTKRRVFLWAGIAQIALSFFGYIIYFIFSLLIFGFLMVWRATVHTRAKLWYTSIRVAYILASIFLILGLSLFASPNARLDVLKTGPDYARDFFVHNFLYLTGFKIPTDSVRPQMGNLLWHLMDQRFVDLPLFAWPYFDTALLFIVLAIMGVGVAAIHSRSRIKNKENPSVFNALVLYLGFVSIVSIFLDRYYLGGIHLLTERMDLVVDVTLVILLGVGLYDIVAWWGKDTIENRVKNRIEAVFFTRRRVILVLVCGVIALFFGSTLISGPVFGRATMADFRAMQAVYKDMKATKTNDYCVLSEHFLLAALEAASGGTIKNGNFPILYGYLEENGQIFIKMFSNPQKKYMDEAVDLATGRGCYFVLPKRFMADWSYGAIRAILGEPLQRVDDVYIWRYSRE